MDESTTGAKWINFTKGDKLKLVEIVAGNPSTFKTSWGGVNQIRTVSYQNGSKVYLDADSAFTGSGVRDDMTDAIFALTQQNWSGRLMNASQITESAHKGDILGECILPLNFWYCRSPGLAIPLVSLHKGTDVELYVQFAGKDDADWTSSTQFANNDPENNFISYDSNINCANDVTNAYKIGSTTFCKPILNDTTNENKFNFNMDVSVIYIFLDNMERQRFKNSSHEYLIEQLQYHRHNSTQSLTIDISSMQHPVKELIWTGQPYLKQSISGLQTNLILTKGSSDVLKVKSLNNGESSHSSGVRFVLGMTGSADDDILYGGGIQNSSYTKGFGNASFSGVWNKNNLPIAADGTGINDEGKALGGNGKFVHGLLGPSTPDCLNYCSYKIILNGTDRCQWKSLQHFTRENVRKYHKGGCISVPDSIAVYSFALNPNDTSPSGTCNFSNIDSIQINRKQTLPGGMLLKRVFVYAINYNILRFVNGQAGLSYVL